MIFLMILTASFRHINARDIESIKASGKIYIGLTKDDRENINYPLAVEFAKYLNVKLIIVEITWEEAFMHNGIIPAQVETDPSVIYQPDIFRKVDIICSTFTMLDWRKKLFDFAETLYSAELMLTDKNTPPVKDFSMLKGRSIAFTGETSFETNLNRINETINGGIILVPTESSEETKELMHAGKVYGIIMDADEALNYNAQSGQKYQIALPISPMTKTAWAVDKGNSLKNDVEEFFRTIESNGVLNSIFQEKFGVTYTSYTEKINKTIRLERYNRDLNEIRRSGKLVIALRERNFIYKEGGEKQFMHALAEEFADHLGVSLEYVITPNLNKYWETAEEGFFRDSAYTPEWFNYFDVACEVFAPLDWREKKIDLIPVYPSDYSVIARKELSINSIEDLRGLRAVTNKSSVYQDILQRNDLNNYYFETINNFLNELMAGKADYTILYNAFSELADYPELESKFALGNTDVCWGLRKDQPELKAELEKFIRQSQNKGLINVLMNAVKEKNFQSPEVFLQSYYESSQSGQIPSVFYGAQDGLPQEDIFSIFQDRKGYIWFGTNSGAVRYNGREMKNFGNMQGLADNSIRAFNQDSAGLLYIATPRGIAIQDRDTIIDVLLPDFSFHSIFVDHSSNKWFIGNDGVYMLSQFGYQRHINSEYPILPEIIYGMEEDITTGDKFFATAEGIFCLFSENNQLSRLTTDETYCLFLDMNDSLWVSEKRGLFMGNLTNLKSGKFRNTAKKLNELLDLPPHHVKSIITNRYGSIWMVTDSEILQVLSPDQPAVIFGQETGLKNNKILSFLIDREDNIWLGFSGGVQRFSNKKGLRNFYPKDLDSYIYSIQQDGKDRLWITSNNGIYYYDNKLVNFTDKINKESVKYVQGILPGGNLLFASPIGFYELDYRSLNVVRMRRFNPQLLGLEGIYLSEKGEIILLTGSGSTIYYFADFHAIPQVINEKKSSNVFQLIALNGRIIGGNTTGLIEIDQGVLRSVARFDCHVWSLYHDDHILWAGTDCGLGYITDNDLSNILYIPIGQNIVIKSVFPAKNKNYLWLGTNRGIAYFNKKTSETEFFIDSRDGLSGDEITPSGLFLDNSDLLWIGTYHGLSNFNPRARKFISFSPGCYIERILLNGKRIETESGKTFRHNQNNFVFELAAPSFSDESSIEYEYYLRGTANDYLSYHKGREFKAYYNNLPPGEYEFIYKAKGKNNFWGYAQKYQFTVSTAWYDTLIFRGGMVLLILISGWMVYRIRISRIEAQKIWLEQQVKQRTRELEEANTEIEAQRDMATSQRDQIASQKKEITDSINYAERIQRSLLPQSALLKKVLPEYFILYKPRDIVSGDFYWMGEKDGMLYIAAADCTGHGVPGAFMSMLGISFLNEILNKTDAKNPDEILGLLRKYIISSLKQDGYEGRSKDGIDMSLVSFDKTYKSLSYAGANNPLYLVRKGELREFKADSMPVGIHDRLDPFTLHTLDLERGDTFYMFSDGYADQFGGPREKKFMYSNFKNLILTIQPKSMREQEKILNDTIEAWKGDISQIDDIVIIGIRF